MLSQEIRRKFLNYFKERGHAVIASSPVVPHDDPTLLFTNAGMNQFKDVFLGKSARDYTRAATAQKCIRVGGKHNDLDNVGHTSRHLTFFEMLGNFSFGDYFKKEAISFAWEVSTKVFEFPEEKIWPTIFENDDEAFELWKQIVPEKRITRLGEKDNFWAMGDTGPCGPCSELYLDRGPQFGDARNPKEDVTGERYLEFWNLVFMQFNRSTSGELSPLPKQSIDTGAGLERIVSLKLGVDTLFGTDILRSLIAEVETISKRKYDPHNAEFAPAYHVIADHIRSLSFAMADGAQPSNLDRGYVLRKLLRRAVRYGRIIGMQDPFLAQILPRLVKEMGADYPELKNAEARIAEVLTLEEENFIRTLKRGGNILSSVIDQARQSAQHKISGEDAFKLKDTYGFPLEEILLIAKDTGLEVHLEQFQILEKTAREKSRSAQAAHHQLAEENLFKEFLEREGPTVFKGFQATMGTGRIIGLVKEGKFVDKLEIGDEAMVFLDETTFYAEKGGQVGDTGLLSDEHLIFKVTDCKMPFPGVIAHIGTMEKGDLIISQTVHISVDSCRRQTIMGHHTATHLLHWALQEVFGSHIRQAGSLVEPDRLRFDFHHHKSVTHQELRQVEELVNEKIRSNQAVAAYEVPYEEVQKKGEVKQFFGDKYGSVVRVVDIDFSKELCGGTHVHHLGTIGLFRILKEGSISAGIRRIEAVTGKPAEEFMYAQENLLNDCAALIKTAPSKIIETASHLLDENKRLLLEIKNYRRTAIKQTAQELLSQIESLQGISFLASEIPFSGEELGLLAEELLQKKNPLILLLGANIDGRAQLLVRVSPELTKRGVSAVQLIKEIAPLIGGSGGGKAESAQAGGKDPSGMVNAFFKAKESVLQILS